MVLPQIELRILNTYCFDPYFQGAQVIILVDYVIWYFSPTILSLFWEDLKGILFHDLKFIWLGLKLKLI